MKMWQRRADEAKVVLDGNTIVLGRKKKKPTRYKIQNVTVILTSC